MNSPISLHSNLERFGIEVDLISTSRVQISVACIQDSWLDQALVSLKSHGDMSISFDL